MLITTGFWVTDLDGSNSLKSGSYLFGFFPLSRIDFMLYPEVRHIWCVVWREECRIGGHILVLAR